MGRTICTECRKKYNEKPPCIKTGQPCKEVGAGLSSENNASQSIRWCDVVLVGGTAELEGLENDFGAHKPLG